MKSRSERRREVEKEWKKSSNRKLKVGEKDKM